MSEKFKAIIIDNQNEKFTREIKEIDTSHLKDGNVLVKVDYSSLNFKDALILNDGGRIVRKFPFVPGIDFAGTVVESEDGKFKKDDKVILTGFRVGEAYFGGFAQYAKVDSNFLIKIPKDLDSHKSMMLGTAGFTALLCSFAVKAKEELLRKLGRLISCPFKVIDQVAGIRPTVKDRRPLVGSHSTFSNLHVLNGLGTRGVMIGPYVAKQFFDFIENKMPLEKEIDIKRFSE